MKDQQKQAIYQLPQRSQQVLKWVVREYVDSGIPVASTHLVEMDRFGVRSATLRNELNTLETDGYLLQPHTSAGRVPTQYGYRYFVDHLMNPQMSIPEIQVEYDRYLRQFATDLDQLIVSTTRFLGEMAQALVLISRPQRQATHVQQIHLHEIDAETVLLIVRMSHGQVKSMAFHLESGINRNLLREAEQMLNDHFKDTEISQFDELAREHDGTFKRSGKVVEGIVNQLRLALRRSSEKEYVHYGSHQLLHYPELASAAVFEPILAALENGSFTTDLPSHLLAVKPTILIGTELGGDYLSPLSAVSLCYRGEDFEGLIHILGPTRMAYEKVVGLASMVTEKMNVLIKDYLNI